MSPWAKALLVFSLLVLSLAILFPRMGLASGGCWVAQEEPRRLFVYVEVQAVNIDGRPLKGALVEVYNKSQAGEKLLNSSITNSTGWARIYVLNGSVCIFKVFWKDAFVGLLDNVTVLANTTVMEPIVCSVCDIVIGVVSARTGAPLANVKITVSGNYTNRYGNQTTLPPQDLMTNITGLCYLRDALMNCTYKLEAFRHNVPFNETVIGPLNGTTVLNITCPSYLVMACIVDEKFRPVQGAVLEAYDWGTGELLVSRQVDEQGLVEFWALPGRCVLKALLRGEVLSEVVAIIDENRTWWPLICKVYNLSLTVVVVDAWGNPIQGLEVRLLVNETVVATGVTDEHGAVVFTSLGKHIVEVLVLSGGEVLAIRWADLSTHRSLTVMIGDKALVFGRLVKVLDLLAYVSMSSVLATLLIVIVLWTRLSRRARALT